MIKTFRSKALADLWASGKAGKISPALKERIVRRLDALDAATRPEDMDLPGFDFHALKGPKPTRYTVHINGPWCITFEFDDGDALRVDLEQSLTGAMHMTEYHARRDSNRAPTHPGALLAEIINDHGISGGDIARRVGLSRQHVYDILAGRKPVSPAVAVRLGKLMGNGAALWLRMQAARDLWEAEREVDTSAIEPLQLEDA